MDQAIAEGRIFVLEIEVNGTQQLRDAGVEGDYIFIVPPSMEELRRRLEARGTNSAQEIAERMAITEEEMKAAHLYDCQIPNAVLEDAIAAVKERIGL